MTIILWNRKRGEKLTGNMNFVPLQRKFTMGKQVVSTAWFSLVTQE